MCTIYYVYLLSNQYACPTVYHSTEIEEEDTQRKKNMKNASKKSQYHIAHTFAYRQSKRAVINRVKKIKKNHTSIDYVQDATQNLMGTFRIQIDSFVE